MRRSRRYIAAGGALAALFVGLGPARSEPPTWHDLFPRLPRDLAARAEDPALTDGRHPITQLRPGVYMTTTARPERCRLRAELTPEARQALASGPKLWANSSRPEPRGPKYASFLDNTSKGGIAAYILSGGCQWRRVGTVKDAHHWFSEYVHH